MTGPEDSSEEVSFKVADRRKFNADGSVREGVVIEPAKPAQSQQTRQNSKEPAATESRVSSAVEASAAGEAHYGSEGDAPPGADDPASFVNFLSTLATNAAAALGAVPHPATGQRSLDLETGKYWLDVLAMIKEKTKGNLHSQESRLVDGLLADLRMQYVAMVRATEEKLKANAAQKFSGSDILGRK